MLDHPFYHGLATDPRENVRELYNSDQMEFFPLSDQPKIDTNLDAKVTDTSLCYRQTTLEILGGLPPSSRVLKDPISIMAHGHHLKLNDVLSNTFNTLLARMFDSGVVAKIFSKYFLTNGKICKSL